VEQETLTPELTQQAPIAATDTMAEPLQSTSQQLTAQLTEFMQVGGPVVWILTAMSVIALAIILVKLVQFAMQQPEKSSHLPKVLKHWRHGELQQAQTLLKPQRPVDELTALTINGLTSAHVELSLLKEELDRVATLRLNQLRAYLRPLEVIATLSPLLGLLGTVLGMIIAFQQMEAAGNQVDPSVLSGGIWQALLTTAVGLAVAIPVVMAHNWMERKVERVAALMNDTVTQLFTSARHSPRSNSDEEAVRHAA
jgi:biopolymer transport protein ExbB